MDSLAVIANSMEVQMIRHIQNLISSVLLGCASTMALAAGAGHAMSDTSKTERSEMTSGATRGAGTGESSSSGASGGNPSRAVEPTGARGTEGRSGATTTRNPNDVVDKPKGMDQPAGSVSPERNSTTR